MNTLTDSPKRNRWARLRYSIIGPLLEPCAEPHCILWLTPDSDFESDDDAA